MGERGVSTLRLSEQAATTLRAAPAGHSLCLLWDALSRQPVALSFMLFLFAACAILWKVEPAAAEPGTSFNLDPKRAYGYLVQICRIGPRVSGTAGMTEQQRLLAKHFSRLKARVRFQSFEALHPMTGKPVRMNNLIVSWHPDAKQRVLLACHYDTRPYPDRDLFQPRGTFLGANDGASGVALFMELAHHMQALEPADGYGVDFVFFDAEELIYGQRGKYFLGSEHFAKDYRDRPPEHRYVFGVLVDMIGDRNLNLYMEKKSLHDAPQVTESIWATARKLGIREFHNSPKPKYDVEDDHVPLNKIAGIPTCDIIDFDYPHWHTTRDVPRSCSGASLAKVGRVLLEWLSQKGKN